MGEAYILGVDIGGTKIRMGLVNRSCTLHHLEVFSSQKVFAEGEPLAQLLCRILTYRQKYLGSGLPAAVAMGFPSSLDRTQRKVLNTPNIKPLQNIAVSDYLEPKLGIPVYLSKDVNLLLLHDIWKLGLPEQENIIGIYVGTGLGNAISIHGNLLIGRDGAATDMGHIPLRHNRLVCGCGNVGCAETLASGSYLRAIQAEHYPDTPIEELFSRHGGDALLQDFIVHLSLPIATEITLIGPDHMILGGGVIHMKDFPLKKLAEQVRQHTRKPYPAEAVRFLISSEGEENGVIGAAIFGWKSLG